MLPSSAGCAHTTNASSGTGGTSSTTTTTITTTAATTTIRHRARDAQGAHAIYKSSRIASIG